MTNPTNLPSRYEIRQLKPEHSEWAAAIVTHSNIFYSTVFSLVYPEKQTARFNAMLKSAACKYLVEHQISSGLSFGVFDTEFQYKRPGSVATNGKFYWDPEDDGVSGQDLLEAMDFPLVSVALAYDGFNAIDMTRMKALVSCLPTFETVYHHLDQLDPRPTESWRPAKERRRVLMRNATSTRHDYEGKGLMAALARYLMREAAAVGFKSVNIECLNDAVTHVWSNPPSPFKGEIVASFKTEDYEEEGEDGKDVNPFIPAKQLVTRVWTTLSDS